MPPLLSSAAVSWAGGLKDLPSSVASLSFLMRIGVLPAYLVFLFERQVLYLSWRCFVEGGEQHRTASVDAGNTSRLRLSDPAL